MALVRRGGIVEIGALIRVGVRERDGQRRAVVGHDVRKHAKNNFAPSDEVLCMLRSRWAVFFDAKGQAWSAQAVCRKTTGARGAGGEDATRF